LLHQERNQASNPNVTLKRQKQTLAMEALFVAYYETMFCDETKVVDDDGEPFFS